MVYLSNSQCINSYTRVKIKNIKTALIYVDGVIVRGDTSPISGREKGKLLHGYAAYLLKLKHYALPKCRFKI